MGAFQIIPLPLDEENETLRSEVTCLRQRLETALPGSEFRVLSTLTQ